MPGNPANCSHIALIKARIKGEFSDKDVTAFVCSACGFPFLAAPMRKFKHNPEALKFFEKIAEEVKLDLPSLS